jgi:hypothetical protein
MPTSKGCLPVSVDYPCWRVSRSLGFHGQVGRKHGFAAAAFLGGNQDCFHEKNLSTKQPLLKLADYLGGRKPPIEGFSPDV